MAEPRTTKRPSLFAQQLAMLLVAFCAGLACVHPALAITHHKHDTREAILALETQWRTAQLSGDVATMDKMLSDDYVGITPFGEMMTKVQQLDRVRNHTFRLTRLDTSDVKVKLIGSIAIVTCHAYIDGSLDGHQIEGDFLYTRVYQHLPSGAWKITSYEATRVPKPGERSAKSKAISPQAGETVANR